MLDRCDHPNCILSVWRPKSQMTGSCYFHSASNGKSADELLYYLEEAYNPYWPEFRWGPDHRLLFLDIDFSSDDLVQFRRLGRTTNRKLVFTKCKFVWPLFAKDMTFHDPIHIDQCRFNDNSESEDVEFEQCGFRAGLTVTSTAQNVTFRQCTFASDLTVITPDGANAEGQSVCLQECRISAGVGPFALRSEGGIQIAQNTIVHERIEIPAPFEFVRIADSVLEKGARISIEATSGLWIENVDVFGHVLIDGAKALQPSPILGFASLRMHNRSVMTFNNLDLSRFDSPDYIFGAAAFDFVKFPTRDSRFVSAEELQIVKEMCEGQRDKAGLSASLEHLRQCYTNLKLHFDRGNDFQMGNHFHSGELWAQWQLQRLERTKPQMLGSWHTWYFWLSDFGQSVTRPIWWLLIAFIVSWPVYSGIGFYPASHWHNHFATIHERIWQGLAFASRPSTFWFRPEGAVPLRPFHWMGWVVAFMQTSITLVAGTFFLLALRRRFKR